MKKKSFNKLFLQILLVFSAVFFSWKKVGASESGIDVVIPVKQYFEVADVKKADEEKLKGLYELTALQTETPMPQSSENGKYQFEMKGQASGIDVMLHYEQAGIYKYKLYQITEEQPNYRYDSAEYQITVYVKNGLDGKLLTEMIAEQEKGEKSGEISFKNEYKQKDSTSNTTNVTTGDTTNVIGYLLMLVGTIMITWLCFFRFV